MTLINPSAFRFGDRFAATSRAMRSGIGKAGRAYFAFIGDSNMFQQPDATTSQPWYPGSHWESATMALSRVFGIYGTSLFGYGGQASWGSEFSPQHSLVGEHSGLTYVPAGAPTYYTNRRLNHNGTSGRWCGSLCGVPTGTTCTIDANSWGAMSKMSVLGNARTAAMRLAYSYMNPTVNTGFISMSVGLAGTLSVHARTTHSDATSDVFADGTLDLPANDTANSYAAKLADLDGLEASAGQFYLSYGQWLKGSVEPTSGPIGAACGCLWGAGSQTLRVFNGDLVAQNRAAIAEHMRCAAKFADHYVVCVAFKGNDITDGTASYLPNGSNTGPASNTAAGWYQNMATLCEIFYRAWVEDLGKDPAKLTIIDWPVWVRAGYELQTTFEDQSIALAQSGGVYGSRLCVVRGSKLLGDLTPTEMNNLMRSLGWHPERGGNDGAHLSVAGYEQWNVLALLTMLAAADPDAIGLMLGGGRLGRVLRGPN